MDLKIVPSGDKKASRSPVDEQQYGKGVSIVSILIMRYGSSVKVKVKYVNPLFVFIFNDHSTSIRVILRM